MQLQCENCLGKMREGVTDWHFQCPICGLEASSLTHGDLAANDAAVDEADREAGLESLRRRAFKKTITLLGTPKARGKLLDVGCAHGWFLDVGAAAGYACTGIEPSTRVAQRALSRGHRVLTGYFPAALEGESGFDVVSYNDVFEHIPGARNIMQCSSKILARDGMLTIAIPSSRGFFYRTSKVLAKIGIMGPFERMWQKNFSSPHLYYFNADVLTQLAADSGLSPVHKGSLPSVSVEGLWDRLTYDTSSSRLMSGLVYIGVVAALPFLRMLPPDIDLLIFRKPA